MRNRLEIFEIPANLCLYEQKADEFTKRLRSEINGRQGEESETRTVLFLQNGDLLDDGESWLNELRHAATLTELRERVWDLRCLFADMQHLDNTVFVYGSANNCLGSFFELALACDYRMWFSSKVHIGFPSLHSGVFPPGGSLEFISLKPTVSREVWEKTPVLPVEKAVDLGLMIYHGSSMNWKSWIRDLCEDKKKPAIKLKRRQLPRSLKIPSELAAGEVQDLNKETIAHYIKEWEKLQTKQEKIIFQQQNSKQKNKKTKTPALDLALTHILSSIILEARSSFSVDFCVNDIHPYQPNLKTNGMIQISADSGPPPISAMMRILDSGVSIFFHGGESKNISRMLDVCFLRLERRLSGKKAQEIWQKQVFWFQGPVKPQLPNFVWKANHLVTLTIEDRSWQFYDVGWSKNEEIEIMEFAEQGIELSERARQSIRLIADKTIKTCLPQSSLSLTEVIRSLLLQELVHMASGYPGHLDALINQLATLGWGFIADPLRWGQFLTSRDSAKILKSMGKVAFGFQIEIDVWEVATWKQVRALIKDREPIRNWNIIECDRRLCLLLSLLIEFCEKHEICRQSELLIKSAAGYPLFRQSPRDFLQEFGTRRTLRYINESWPFFEKESIPNA